MKSNCKYNHDVCNLINSQGGAKGGAALVIIIDNNKVLLPFDRYRKMYAICAGKRSKDETCYIETIERESLEEIKINISAIQFTNSNSQEKLNEHFINEKQIRFVVVNKTPVFIGKYNAEELDIEALNKIIESDNNNPLLSKDFKEVLHLKLFNLSSIKKLERKCIIKDENEDEHRIHDFTFSVLESIQV